MPDFTVQDWASIKWSDDPQFQREYARMVEGFAQSRAAGGRGEVELSCPSRHLHLESASLKAAGYVVKQSRAYEDDAPRWMTRVGPLFRRTVRPRTRSATPAKRQLRPSVAEIKLHTELAAFAKAERDQIRERIGQLKADQKARNRYLGGKVPFGFRRGDDGELVPHEAEQEAIREMVALRTQPAFAR